MRSPILYGGRDEAFNSHALDSDNVVTDLLQCCIIFG